MMSTILTPVSFYGTHFLLITIIIIIITAKRHKVLDADRRRDGQVDVRPIAIIITYFPMSPTYNTTMVVILLLGGLIDSHGLTYRKRVVGIKLKIL